jgi:hypothetical protein
VHAFLWRDIFESHYATMELSAKNGLVKIEGFLCLGGKIQVSAYSGHSIEN